VEKKFCWHHSCLDAWANFYSAIARKTSRRASITQRQKNQKKVNEKNGFVDLANYREFERILFCFYKGFREEEKVSKSFLVIIGQVGNEIFSKDG
jgi:hypothetical protein